MVIIKIILAANIILILLLAIRFIAEKIKGGK